METSASKKEIITFAQKYIDFFEKEFGSDESKYKFFGEVEFAEECEALGFEMDCGTSFDQAAKELWNENESAETNIAKFNDIKILGNKLYSEWRYYNHWDSPSHANEGTKKWLLILLRRLVSLCSQNE